MPITHTIYSDWKTVYISVTGCATLVDFLDNNHAMYLHSDWANGHNILLDLRQVKELRLSSSDIQTIIHADEAHEALYDKSRCAIVASDNLAYGIARMWESLSADSPLDKTVFREMSEALEWLGIEQSFPALNHNP